jgi:hypothetical protein
MTTATISKKDQRTLTANARRGARLLVPGWWKTNRIAIGRLELNLCTSCVIGQLTAGGGNWYENDFAENVLGLAGQGSYPERYGFDVPSWMYEHLLRPIDLDSPSRSKPWYDYLAECWKAEIRNRRAG